MEKLTKALTIILLGLLGLTAVLALVGLFLPETARVERSITVNAPQSTVFALGNSFRRIHEWSPWHDIDPQAEWVIDGPAMGVGARMSWTSDDPQLGTGREEITLSEPYSLVKSSFDFGEEGLAESTFACAPVNDGTRVTWSLQTDLGKNIVSRYFGLMFDRMMGPYFERGLARLKAVAEGLPDEDWSDVTVGIHDLDPIPIAVTSGQAPADHAAIGQALESAYMAVSAFMAQHRLETAGTPLAITKSWDAADGWSFFAGIPIAASATKAPGPEAPVRIGQTPAGLTVVAEHVGPYAGISSTFAKAHAFRSAYGLEQAGPEWEQFVSDPGETPESELITRVCIPVR